MTFVRTLMSSAVFSLALALSSPANAAPSDLAGTWNVTATWKAAGTCGNHTKGKTQAYIWLISTEGNDVNISVQGETKFPKISGIVGNNRMVLGGVQEPFTLVQNAYYSNVVWLTLEFANGTWRGTRRFLGYKSVDLKNGKKGTIPCFSDAELTVTR